MVLVLASGDAGHYTQVHDFANYPARQQFATAHLSMVASAITSSETTWCSKPNGFAARRASDNISGWLHLELSAFAEAYRGGTFDGHELGTSILDG